MASALVDRYDDRIAGVLGFHAVQTGYVGDTLDRAHG
jgi:hypothetical protein